MVGRLLASSPAGEEPRSCYSIYPTSEKLKNQQLYLESETKGISIEVSNIKVRSPGKPLPPKLETQKGRTRESQPTRAETCELKPPWEPVSEQEITNCWRLTCGQDGGFKTLRDPDIGGSPHLVSFDS